MRLPLTPSGLTIDRVRSSAISLRPLLCQWFGAGSIHGRRIAPVLWGSREVYLGSLECGNVSDRGSARKLRVFRGPDPRRRGDLRRTPSGCGPEAGLQTEKLSPQPHSPLTFGLRKEKASFS